MDELELQTIDDLFDDISVGDAVSLPSSADSYDDMFRIKMNEYLFDFLRKPFANPFSFHYVLTYQIANN